VNGRLSRGTLTIKSEGRTTLEDLSRAAEEAKGHGIPAEAGIDYVNLNARWDYTEAPRGQQVSELTISWSLP
jgi:hypothetical protein